jgi:hypothetical protein
MSVPNTTQRADYTGSGTTGPFTFNFKIFSESQLLVIKTYVVSDADTTLALTTDYTVSGVGEDSGSITLTSALAVGYTLTILRNVDYLQEAVFGSQRQQNARTWEDTFDHSRMLDLQLKRQLDGAIKLPDSEDADDFDMTLPKSSDRAGKLLVCDDDGNIDVIASASSLGGYTATRLLFGGSGGLPAQSSSLTWDDSNLALTIGLSRYFTIATDNLVIWGGSFNITGHYNIFIGKQCGSSYTSGNCSTAMGYQALRITVNGGAPGATGEGNSAFGYVALGVNTTGESLSAFGYTAGASNTTGIESCYFGAAAGYSNQTGNGCTAIGHQASKLATGTKITSLGWQAGYNDTTGFDNLYLGASCDAGAAGIQNAAAIGYAVTVSTSHTMVLGNSSLATVRNAGNNTCDLGSSALPWKSLYWGTQAFAPDGTKSAPGYSWTNDTTSGWFRAASGAFNFSVSGASYLQLSATALSLSSGMVLRWWNGSLDSAGAYDVVITRTGTKALQILNDSSGSLGFFAASPVVQQAGTGETVGFTAGGGTTVTDASTFTGNVGSKAYRISDIVKALKNLGLMASS